jgi:hypothetical protein
MSNIMLSFVRPLSTILTAVLLGTGCLGGAPQTKEGSREGDNNCLDEFIASVSSNDRAYLLDLPAGTSEGEVETLLQQDWIEWYPTQVQAINGGGAVDASLLRLTEVAPFASGSLRESVDIDKSTLISCAANVLEVMATKSGDNVDSPDAMRLLVFTALLARNADRTDSSQMTRMSFQSSVSMYERFLSEAPEGVRGLRGYGEDEMILLRKYLDELKGSK